MGLLYKKNKLRFLTVALFFILIMNGTAAAVPAATTLYVDAQGNGNYTTIQDAVNNASSGDTILVYPGTYTENVNANVENISIRSFSGNPDDTIVKRLCVLSHAFKITANNVTISGFNITGEKATGIYMNGVSGANITDNEFSGVGCGVQMERSSRCSLINNTVNGAVQHGFYLSSSSNNCILTNNTISHTGEEGISLEHSNNCTLTGNTVTGANSGISLYYSDECVLRNNTARSGRYGINLWETKNFTLTGNIMSGNWYNFNFDPYYYDLDNATGNIIDTSNLVDGKVIYYLEGEANPSIGSDAGVVYCINCGNVEIKDLVLQNNTYGFFLYNTSSEIQNNTISNTEYGITVLSSHDVKFSDNRLEHSHTGAEFYESMNITFTDNTIRDSICGSLMADSYNCTLTGNSIQSSTGNYNLLASGNSAFVEGGKNSFISKNTHMNSNSVHDPRPFELLESSNYTLSNNTLTDSAVSYPDSYGASFYVYGIGIYNSSYCALASNTVSNAYDEGIYLRYSSSCNLTDNTVSHTYDGISVHYSDSCSLDGNNISDSFENGIYLSNSSSYNLTGNTVSNTTDNGVYLFNSSSCNLIGNVISYADYGIYVNDSSSCTLTNNTVTDANSGISLYSSDECVLRNNTASSGRYGISLREIQNCTLTGNIMSGNWYNFDLKLYDFDNTTGNVIDTSNLVDGKKIYYFEGEPNPSVGCDAGVVYCINSGKVEIKDLVLQNNSYTVFLYNTSSEMQNNTINNSVCGIMVLSSHDVNISDIRVDNSMMGVSLNEVTDVILADNVIKNSLFGIATGGCENCTLTGNYIQGSINNSGLLASENSRLVRGGENSFIKENTLMNPNLVQVSSPFIFGIYSLNSQGLKLENNSIDTGLIGIYLIECQNARIVRNSVRNIENVGIYSMGSSSVELLENTVQNITGEIPIYTSGNSSLISSPLVSNSLGYSGPVSSSLFSSPASRYGIYFGFSEDIRLKDNTVKDSYQASGIYLSEPLNATLENNTLQNCRSGIVTLLSENLSVSNCSITNCTGGFLVANPREGTGNEYTISGCTVKESNLGLLIMGKGILSGCSIEDNNIGLLVTGEGTFTENTLSGNLYGLVLYDANNSLICGNTVAHNSLAGIAVDPGSEIMSHSGLVGSMENPRSGNNTIYNNYFNNTNNTLINSGANNAWNISKTAGKSIVSGPYLGGNYWVNPNGTGFSETCTDMDRDGIADSSYKIVSGTFDYLPLTNVSSAPIYTTTHRHKSSTNYFPSIGESTDVTGVDSAQKKVVSGSKTSFRFSDPVSGVLGLSFTPQECSGNVIVRIEILGNGSSVEVPEGEVYRLMNIQVGNERFEREDNINGASINFRVSRSWIEENNIDVSTISMNRFHAEEWNALPTEMTGEDEEFYYFSAETPGFSHYAVTGDKVGTGNTQGTEIITPAEEEETAATGDEQTKDEKAPGFESTLAVLGVFSSLFFAKRRL